MDGYEGKFVGKTITEMDVSDVLADIANAALDIVQDSEGSFSSDYKDGYGDAMQEAYNIVKKAFEFTMNRPDHNEDDLR